MTVPKRGYRFQAAVTREPSAPDGADTDFTVPSPIAAARPLEEPAAVPLPSLAAAPRRPPRLAAWSLGAIAALAMLAPAAMWSALQRARNADPAPSPIAIHALAILPFELISDDTRDQSLGLGLADALITRLSDHDKLRIQPLGAVRRYADTRDPTAAGRELAVDAVLDGTIQQLAGQTRVSVRLIRVDSGATLWTATFDAPGATPFALEDSISQSLATALALELGEGRHR